MSKMANWLSGAGGHPVFQMSLGPCCDELTELNCRSRLQVLVWFTATWVLSAHPVPETPQRVSEPSTPGEHGSRPEPSMLVPTATCR